MATLFLIRLSHYVKMVSDVLHYDVFHKGQRSGRVMPSNKEGINVNFVEQPSDDEIIVRTYERGGKTRPSRAVQGSLPVQLFVITMKLIQRCNR
jgi:diaminopimelate epimerase